MTGTEKAGGDESGLLAHRCEAGHLTYPGHAVCPECGRDQTATVDLSDRTGEVVTWTISRATPSGVRAPNTLAIVAFDVGGSEVRVLGQVTTTAVESGDAVTPVHVDQLRDPETSLRDERSQHWDGYRFEPV